MRRVVAYCKRHLAQEEKAKRDTESKSMFVACLKNRSLRDVVGVGVDVS